MSGKVQYIEVNYKDFDPEKLSFKHDSVIKSSTIKFDTIAVLYENQHKVPSRLSIKGPTLNAGSGLLKSKPQEGKVQLQDEFWIPTNPDLKEEDIGKVSGSEDHLKFLEVSDSIVEKMKAFLITNYEKFITKIPRRTAERIAEAVDEKVKSLVNPQIIGENRERTGKFVCPMEIVNFPARDGKKEWKTRFQTITKLTDRKGNAIIPKSESSVRYVPVDWDILKNHSFDIVPVMLLSDFFVNIDSGHYKLRSKLTHGLVSNFKEKEEREVFEAADHSLDLNIMDNDAAILSKFQKVSVSEEKEKDDEKGNTYSLNGKSIEF